MGNRHCQRLRPWSKTFNLFLNACWKFLKISSLLAVRETIHIGEGEHQCSCFRIGEVEGSILSDLCCAFFDIYTFITREVAVPECASVRGADAAARCHTGPVQRVPRAFWARHRCSHLSSQLHKGDWRLCLACLDFLRYKQHKTFQVQHLSFTDAPNVTFDVGRSN